VYLPYTPRVFGLASQVAWYLDEIVVRDPIVSVLVTLSEDLGAAKEQVRKRVQFLAQFRPYLEAGYMLLHGTDLLPPPSDQPNEDAIALSRNAEVLRLLHDTAQFGIVSRPDSRGEPSLLCQVELDHGFLVGFVFDHPVAGVEGPPFQVGERFPAVTYEEFAARLPDFAKQMEPFLAIEVHHTLWSLQAGYSLGTAVLYDRRVDAAIASRLTNSIHPGRQLSTVGALAVTLPYVQGIPPDRLVELRESLPEAFLSFRAVLSEIVRAAASADADSEEVQRRAESTIRPELNKLDSEIAAEIRKARIKGWGSALVAGAGILAGGAVAGTAAGLVAGVVTGTIGVVNVLAESAGAKRRALGNPFYFLWRARSSR